MNESTSKSCFVISPISEDGSAVRIRADKVLRHIIRPVCEELNYVTKRADEINDPGLISRRIIREIITSDLVVADLTGHNPNVFYELAIRHFVGRPFVQIIEKSDALPFDVYDLNTIKIDHNDIDCIIRSKERLRELIASGASSGFIETPVTAVLDALSIAIPTKREVRSTEEQLSVLTQRIISELDQSKKERTLLIEKLMETRSSASTGSGPKDKSYSVGTYEGVWNSNNGLVKLHQDGTDIFGEYQFGDTDWRGDIIGFAIDRKIVFSWRWKNENYEGLGFWEEAPDGLQGAWWYDYENELTLDKLITYPETTENLSRRKSQEWNLRRA